MALLTRRDFLQRSAVGVTLSRYKVSPNQIESSITKTRSNLPFIYGTHFYHPGGPPRNQVRDMLKAIAQEHRFNIVRIYPPWDYYNPAPGRFAFDDVEEVLTNCDELGLRVLMTVLLESAPYWLECEHPECRYVDAMGHIRPLEGSGASYTGGWPGLCLDWPVIQEAAERFIEELVKISISHPSLYAYDVWNEPVHVMEAQPEWGWDWITVPDSLYCYCEKTIEQFRGWLQERYGTLDKLGKAWNRGFSDWQDVNPPRRPVQTYQDLVDWRRFIISQTTKYIQLRTHAVRTRDRLHLIETHMARFAPLTPTAVVGVNAWRLAEQVNTFGLSLYPRWWNLDFYEGAARIEVTRSNAAGKEFWITELQGGRGAHGSQPSPPMRPRDIRVWNWLSIAAGAKGIIYWAYLAEGSGREATGFGLVTRDGEPTERVREATRDNEVIQANWEILKNYRPTVNVALLYDEDDALLAFAMDGKEEASTRAFSGYYRAFWQLDQWVDFIEPIGIDYRRYKVLAAPWSLIGKRDTCERLKHFVNAGGTLILQTPFGAYNQSLYCNAVVPPYGLDAVFGYREGEVVLLCSEEDCRQTKRAGSRDSADVFALDSEIEFSIVPTKLKGETFIMPLQLSSAEQLATCNGLVVAAMKSIGNGRVYYVGTNLGGALSSGDQGAFDIIRTILSPVLRPTVSATKLRPRLIEGSAGSLLAVFNDTPEDQTDLIHLPRSYSKAVDIYDGNKPKVDGDKLIATVASRNVGVFSLEG